MATDKPVYPPWFASNDPANGKGYESAVAYAVAAQLGFKKSQVKWAYEPFNDSYAPGPKKFDFDANEVSVTPARAQAVTFSTSYYNVQQALVALKGTPIVTKHAPADLKSYVFGDQVGTTSLAFINSQIQPTQTPKVYESLNDVKQGLQTHQIAALVADTPTAQYISSSEIKNSLHGRPVPVHRRALRAAVPQGQPAGGLREQGAGHAEPQRHAGRAGEEVPAGLPERADDQALMVGPPQTSFGEPRRGSRLLGSGRGAVAVSTASTIVVLARPGRAVPAGPGQRRGPAHVLQPGRHVEVPDRRPPGRATTRWARRSG